MLTNAIRQLSDEQNEGEKEVEEIGKESFIFDI